MDAELAMNKLFAIESDHPLFRYFTEEERQSIEDIARLHKVDSGDYLIRAGDTDATLFTVEAGHLDIVARGDNVIATVGPGDVLGETSFIDDSPRTVSVRAGEEPVMVRAWDKKTLSEALAFEPQLLAKFAVAMCELLVERLRDTARRV
jgi:CRP-like cAMP-binding protein